MPNLCRGVLLVGGGGGGGGVGGVCEDGPGGDGLGGEDGPGEDSPRGLQELHSPGACQINVTILHVEYLLSIYLKNDPKVC